MNWLRYIFHRHSWSWFSIYDTSVPKTIHLSQCTICGAVRGGWHGKRDVDPGE